MTLTSTSVQHQTVGKRVEKKTLLVVVSPPRFIVKPPAKVFPGVGSTLILHCKANGDPQPVISWKKQDGQLPAGRSHQLINGTLVIRDITVNDRGIYKCIAPYCKSVKDRSRDLHRSSERYKPLH